MQRGTAHVVISTAAAGFATREQEPEDKVADSSHLFRLSGGTLSALLILNEAGRLLWRRTEAEAVLVHFRSHYQQGL